MQRTAMTQAEIARVDPITADRHLAYLKPPRFCPLKTIMAISATLLVLTIITLFCLNCSKLVLKIDIASQMKLFFLFNFLLACTLALWKHARVS